MADFSDHGKHCEDPYCRQKDLLPLRCDACGKTYCSVHFKYEAHSCSKGFAGKDRRAIVCPICKKGVPIPPGEDENAVFARHEGSAECRRHTVETAAKPRCPVKGCKEKLTTLNTFKCGTCGKQVCMKHRFEDAHECVPPPPRLQAGAPCRGASRTFMKSIRSMVK
jgi:hypothetical protein